MSTQILLAVLLVSVLLGLSTSTNDLLTLRQRQRDKGEDITTRL
jgi:hypothetical protein